MMKTDAFGLQQVSHHVRCARMAQSRKRIILLNSKCHPSQILGQLPLTRNRLLTIVIDHGTSRDMKEIAISVFKAKCLGILEEVRKTRKPIRVTRFGKPVAEV